MSSLVCSHSRLSRLESVCSNSLAYRFVLSFLPCYIDCCAANGCNDCGDGVASHGRALFLPSSALVGEVLAVVAQGIVLAVAVRLVVLLYLFIALRGFYLADQPSLSHKLRLTLAMRPTLVEVVDFAICPYRIVSVEARFG